MCVAFEFHRDFPHINGRNEIKKLINKMLWGRWFGKIEKEGSRLVDLLKLIGTTNLGLLISVGLLCIGLSWLQLGFFWSSQHFQGSSFWTAGMLPINLIGRTALAGEGPESYNDLYFSRAVKTKPEFMAPLKYFCLLLRRLLTKNNSSLEIYLAKNALKLFASMNCNVGKVQHKYYRREFKTETAN